MTDEEMANESLISYRKEPKWAGKIFMQDENTCYKDGFLAGLKAGKPQWHDLRKDPNDLPKPNISVLICLQFEKWTTTYIAYYRPAINKWQMYNMHEAQRQPIVEDYIDSDEVIAWCEIPKYKENENV